MTQSTQLRKCGMCGQPRRTWKNKFGTYTFWCEGCDAL